MCVYTLYIYNVQCMYTYIYLIIDIPLLYNDDDRHTRGAGFSEYMCCICISRLPVRKGIVHRSVLYMSAKDTVLNHIVHKLKEAVQDNEVLDDHAADYEPHQSGREEDPERQRDPDEDGERDEQATPAVACAMAYP